MWSFLFFFWCCYVYSILTKSSTIFSLKTLALTIGNYSKNLSSQHNVFFLSASQHNVIGPVYKTTCLIRFKQKKGDTLVILVIIDAQIRPTETCLHRIRTSRHLWSPPKASQSQQLKFAQRFVFHRVGCCCLFRHLVPSLWACLAA